MSLPFKSATATDEVLSSVGGQSIPTRNTIISATAQPSLTVTFKFYSQAYSWKQHKIMESKQLFYERNCLVVPGVGSVLDLRNTVTDSAVVPLMVQ